MNLRRLEKIVLNELHGFSIHDGYFFSKTYEHILFGYCLEKTPNGLYLWRFLYPMYDSFRSVHLTFGERVFDGSNLLFDAVSEKVSASKLVEFILQDVYFLRRENPISIEEFLSNCHASPIGMKNAHVQLLCLMSQFLLGRVDEVIHRIDIDERALGKKDLAFYRNWVALLGRDVSLAKELVLENEKYFLGAWGLS